MIEPFLATNRCGDTLRGRFDSVRQLSFAMFLAIDSHEFGHFLGLGHETRDRAALMFPSIHQAGISRGGTPNATDQRNLLRIGYRRRVTEPGPGPEPDPPNEPNNDRSIILAKALEKTLEAFINNTQGGGTLVPPFSGIATQGGDQ